MSCAASDRAAEANSGDSLAGRSSMSTLVDDAIESGANRQKSLEQSSAEKLEAVGSQGREDSLEKEKGKGDEMEKEKEKEKEKEMEREREDQRQRAILQAAPAQIPTPNPPSPYPPYEKLAQKDPSPWDHLGITLGLPVILLFDIVVPCIIYYAWYNYHARERTDACASYVSRNETCPIPTLEHTAEILGYAVISFGFGEVYILIVRVLRLLNHRDQCAPLLSRSKWELDATSWVYAVSMLMALIPFVVSSTLEIPELYLYSPCFLMGFLGILMFATMLPIEIPIGVNSQPRGTKLRPFIYYAAEDFIAVDGLQDREFRVRYNARYESSRTFRRMFFWLTIWWISGVMIYIGSVSAVVWTRLEFHYAFGLTLGILFSYIAIWAVVTHFFVKWEMGRQRKAHIILNNSAGVV